jgi:hypothetical protein
MLSGSRIAAHIKEADELDPDAALRVYWCGPVPDRESLAEDIKAARGEHPIQPLVVRKAVTPEVILVDLVDIVEEYEDEIRALPSTGRYPVSVVLILRSNLNIDHGSSPTALPEWFPRKPGETVQVQIEALASTASAAFSADETRVGEVATHLFSLETELLRRLEKVHGRDPRLSQAWLAAIADSRRPIDGFDSFLSGAQDALSRIRNTEAYRPSGSNLASLAGRIVNLAERCSPNQLLKPGKALVTALDVPPNAGAPPLPAVGVLLRPTQPITDPRHSFGRGLLISVFTATQLINASAHADEYPTYPATILSGLSFDLRRSMVNYSEFLSQLPPVSEER